MSLPLLTADQVVGSINCYARESGAFGRHAVQLGSKFAGPAAVSVYNAQLLIGVQEQAQHLHSRLTNRTIIDQAIGIVRGRTGVTAEDAFNQMRRISQSEKVAPAVIAQRVLDEALRRALSP
jgi:hypothetical protein